MTSMCLSCQPCSEWYPCRGFNVGWLQPKPGDLAHHWRILSMTGNGPWTLGAFPRKSRFDRRTLPIVVCEVNKMQTHADARGRTRQAWPLVRRDKGMCRAELAASESSTLPGAWRPSIRGRRHTRARRCGETLWLVRRRSMGRRAWGIEAGRNHRHHGPSPLGIVRSAWLDTWCMRTIT